MRARRVRADAGTSCWLLTWGELLRRQESIRTAFLLSQGGEFAFVLLSLANELKVRQSAEMYFFYLLAVVSNDVAAGTSM